MPSENIPEMILKVTDTVIGYSYIRNFQNNNDKNYYIVPTYLLESCTIEATKNSPSIKLE
jgi:hypothetical protein